MAPNGINDSPIRFLIIGVGPHAKTTYIPHLKSFESDGRVNLVAGVDVFENQQTITEYQQKTCPNMELHFVPSFTTNMPEHVAKELTQIVVRLRISFVIIATEPRAHVAYGLWALSIGLNILMDKPISTRNDVCASYQEALSIAHDFRILLEAYMDLQRVKKTCFLVHSHRRYHPGFHHTLKMIRDIQEKTGCPVTNVTTTNCDGQWRMPAEIVDELYHGYNLGHGKVSHSGYHFVDILYQIVKAGLNNGKDKRPDRIEVVSSFVQPNGFLMQLNTGDYEKLFGAEEYRRSCKYSDQDLKRLYASFGEVEASIQFTFLKDNEAIALAQMNVSHNGFTRRHWLLPASDLYKGNGRVRHEMHEITSGPFQKLIVSAKQAHKRPGDPPSESTVGNNNHFELQVFRNSDILNEPVPFRTLTVDDIEKEDGSRETGFHLENVKRGIIEEAIDFMEHGKDLHALRSNLPDHNVPVHLMSAIYISHIRRKAGLNPVVSMKLEYPKGQMSVASFPEDRVDVGTP